MTITPIQIAPVHDGRLPTKAHAHDAGWDCYAASMTQTDHFITFNLGFRIAIPKGFYGDLRPRSSVRKYGLIMCNSCGVIDCGYRGEVQVSFYRSWIEPTHVYRVGDRIAQLIITRIPDVALEVVPSLSDNTDRGQGGFGSTGA